MVTETEKGERWWREKESERDSERRQRPFFDKLVTRRQASSLAKGERVARQKAARGAVAEEVEAEEMA